MKDDFYKQLTENEKQMCDLCRDWNLGKCEKCEFISRFFSQNNQQEVKQHGYCVVHNRLP